MMRAITPADMAKTCREAAETTRWVASLGWARIHTHIIGFVVFLTLGVAAMRRGDALFAVAHGVMAMLSMVVGLRSFCAAAEFRVKALRQAERYDGDAAMWERKAAEAWVRGGDAA